MTNMTADHSKALEFYKKNQDKLVSDYNGKTLILDGENILDVKDTFQDAYDYASNKYGLGNFSLQEVSPDEASYTAYIATPGLIT